MYLLRWTMRALIFAFAISAASAQPSPVRLELIPPSPISDKVEIDIRGAIQNDSAHQQQFTANLYLDQETPSDRISADQLTVPAHASRGVYARRSAAGLAGKHRVILVVTGRDGTRRCES